MVFKVPEAKRIHYGQMGSDASYGNNGQFFIPKRGKLKINVMCQASDGYGWEHVSTSAHNRCLTWDEMCLVKALFWDAEDTVIQFHPAQENYVNNHPFCLHLWRPIGIEIQLPPSILVGVRTE